MTTFHGLNLKLLEDGHASITFDDDDGSVHTIARFRLGTHTDQEFQQTTAALTAAYPVLKQWALDAQDAYDTWPTKTVAQKDAVQRETIRRLGIFFNRFADLIASLNADI